MKRSYEYIIQGSPIALARPRFSRNHVYDSQKHLKLAAGIYLRNQHKDLPMLSGPLALTVTFYMALPAKMSLKKKNFNDGKYHVIKPDFSNLLKFCEDICNGIVFKDDALIAQVSGKKIYGLEPRTEIKIEELLDEKKCGL